MPSPFPGMNPYLEHPEVWHDFHASFLPALRSALLKHLDARYVVTLEARIYVRELPAEEASFLGRADVGVSHEPREAFVPAETTAMAAPVICQIATPVDIERESYLEIRRRDNRQLVTVMELLSPSNKAPGVDRAAYIKKRNVFLSASDVNFVELDFLRGGPRMPLSGLPDCDYYVMVARPADRPDVGVWPIRLRDRLPTVPIPLLRGEPEVSLDLQSILDQVYDDGGYDRYIYDLTPVPPLGDIDKAWAASLMAKIGPQSATP